MNQQQPRVILLCASSLAMPAIQELLFFGHLFAIVIPEKCIDLIADVKQLLSGNTLPLIIVNNKNYVSSLSTALKQYQINTGIIITFSYVIPASIFKSTLLGFYNIHPGPLPSYRGGDPVFQQIVQREKLVGVTMHQVDEGIDTGPVVMQEMVRLNASDTYGMVTSKLALVSVNLVRTLIKLLGLGIAIPTKIQDETQARYFKRQSASDIVINWQTMNGADIVALINACNPWNKGAVTSINNTVVRLMEATVIDGTILDHVVAGTIVQLEANGCVVALCDNTLLHVQIVHTELGFFAPARLVQLGIKKGMCFQSYLG